MLGPGYTAWDYRGVLTFLRAALSGPVDPDDLDSLHPELVRRAAPIVDRICRIWYRLEVEGIDHIPKGPALLVGNHNSGVSFYEAIGAGARVCVQRPDEIFHGLGHDAVVQAPLVGRLLVRGGVLRASHKNADAIFGAGRKIWVFPGGNLEAFRSWRRRHEIDFGGRTGFLKLAIRHEVPIVPAVSLGGQSGFFVIHDGRRLAKLLRADRLMRASTWPIMIALPWGIAVGPLPHIPLPVKCRTRILPPISTAGCDAEDPVALRRLYDEVTGVMQVALKEMAR